MKEDGPSAYSLAELGPERARFWLSLDYWTRAEAQFLLHALDPELVRRQAQANGGRWNCGLPETFPEVATLLQRAEESRGLSFPAAPALVVKWALGKNIRLPAALIPEGYTVQDGRWVPRARAHLVEGGIDYVGRYAGPPDSATKGDEISRDGSVNSWIELTPGEAIRFGDLAYLMATALHGDTLAAAGAQVNLENELPKLVRARVLTPRDPLGMGPHPLPIGEALKDARLRPDDELRAFLADRGIGLRILPTIVFEARPQRMPPELAALPDDARVTFKRLNSSGVGKASDLREMIQEAMARQRDGFFEVGEAAQVLAEARGGDGRDFKEDMRKAWQSDQLRMRHPGKRTVKSGPDNWFSVFDWVSVDDVNAWLKADGCGYEFPAAAISADAMPSAETEPAAPEQANVKPVARFKAQEQAVLTQIAAMGLTACALPSKPAGKPGVKTEVRRALKVHPLFVGEKIFDKAWERLRARGEIADSSSPALG